MNVYDEYGSPVIERDVYDRPKIIRPDGKTQAYTRTSKMAKTLSDEGGLGQWKMQTLIRGLARRPDLLDAMRTVHSDQGEHKLSHFDSLIEEARDAGGGNDGSRWGTLVHGLAEWYDANDYLTDDDGTFAPDVMDALHRYIEVTKPIEMLACEAFAVQDDILCAGTFDRLGVLPDGRAVICDIKTAPDIHTARDKIAEAAMQMAIYSRSVLYHPDGTRTQYEDAFGVEVEEDLGIIIQISRKRDGDRLIAVDLNAGWRNVQRALEVRQYRRQAPIQIGLEPPPNPVPF